MKLYELAECYQALKENEELPPDDVVLALQKLDLMLEEKILSITRWVLDIQGDLAAIKSEEDRLATKRKGVQGRIESLKKYMCDCMVKADVKIVKNETLSVTVQKNQPSVVINDDTVIPAEYWQPPVSEVDKGKILEVWKTSKTIVPGTFIETSKKHIVIR